MNSAPRPRFVFVVDDDDDLREILELVLQSHGFWVATARDGEEALALLHDAPEKPSLVLLDLMMPRLDGAAFLERLHSEAQLCDIPVVILSGDVGARRIGEALHAAGCLTKPVDLPDLVRTVEHYAGT